MGYAALWLTLSCFIVSCHSSRQLQQSPSTPHRTHTRHTPRTQETRSVNASRAEMLNTAATKLGLKPDLRRDNARLLSACASWLGTPYVYGGNGRKGIDCSALTLAIYKDVYGKRLHRRSIDQYEKDVLRISRTYLRQGDLIFFSSPRSGGRCGHVGIYLRDGYFLHASSSRGVVVSHLDGSYYQRHYLGCGRVPEEDLHDPRSSMP